MGRGIAKVAGTWKNWEKILQHGVIVPNEGQRPEGKGMAVRYFVGGSGKGRGEYRGSVFPTSHYLLLQVPVCPVP